MEPVWRRIGITAWAVLASSVVAACSTDVTVADGGCIGATPERFEGVEWANVDTVDVRIRQDNFRPMVFALLRDRPYILRISNGDASSHSFRSSQFFETVAIDAVTVKGEAKPEGCITALSIPAGETVEIRLVALVDGHYGFRDSGWIDPLYESGSGFGAIYVD